MSTISGFNSLMAQAYNQPNQQIENAQRQAAINAAQVQAQGEQAQIPLIQQQTQAAQLENQQRQIQLNDMQGISALYAKHADDNWTDPATQEAFNTDLAKSSVSWPARLDYQNKMLQFQQAHLNLKKEDFDLEEKTNGRVYEILSAFKNAPDATKPQLWAQSSAPALNRLGVGQFDPTNPPLGVALDSLIGNVGHQRAMLEEAKTKQETKGLAAAEAETEAKTTGEKIKNQLEQSELDHYQTITSVPGALEQFVNRSIPKAQYPALHQAAVNEAQQQTNMKGIRDVVQKYSQDAREQERQIAVETNPQVSAIRTQQAVNTAVATEKAKADLALPGFNSIIEPGARMRAETAYQKINEDYQSKVAAAQQLNDLTELVQQGNKAAAGRIPMATVRGFTSRFNKQELESVGAGAGNALDRVNAFLEHNFSKSGADISPDVLKDMQTVNAAQDEAAYNSYKQQVDVLSKSNGLTGAKAIQPLERIPVRHGAAAPPQRPASIPRGSRAQYNPATQQWRYSTDGGNTWQIAKGG